MPTRNINLTDRYDSFLARQIETGRFKFQSAILQDGLDHSGKVLNQLLIIDGENLPFKIEVVDYKKSSTVRMADENSKSEVETDTFPLCSLPL